MRLVFLSFLLWSCGVVLYAQTASSHINGLSFVAPPKPFEGNPMLAVKQVNASHIAVIPFAYTRQGQANVRYNQSGYQWWGERPDGVRETIRLANASGLKVLLKPQVYIPGSWPGELEFEEDSDWESWEQAYETYILTFVKIAEEMKVDMFCIGTEFRESTKQRPYFWNRLIKKIRSNYSGQLTYAANWDDYDQITLWSQLDYIGIDAYFPMDGSSTPDMNALIDGWHDVMKKIQSFADRFEKEVIFTEFGFLSIDGCAGKNWELEKNIRSHEINEQAQAIALEALLSTCSKYSCWKGGFLWKWFPEGQGHEGYIDRDYTPQGKKAEAVLTKLYGIRIK